MGTVTEIDDGFSYIFDDDSKTIESVMWMKRGQYVLFRNEGAIVESLQKIDGSGIGKHELRQLMIMWLALNYPDCLAFDKLEDEEKIRDDLESSSNE